MKWQRKKGLRLFRGIQAVYHARQRNGYGGRRHCRRSVYGNHNRAQRPYTQTRYKLAACPHFREKFAYGNLYVLKPAYVDGQIDLANSIYIDWGAFINAIINFLIIAFVLFCIVKGLNSLANARANLVGGVATDERKAVAAYRRQGMTKAQAKAKYAEDVAKAEAEKAEQERLEKEAEEAKATANTRLLEEIRDTLKALSEKG